MSMMGLKPSAKKSISGFCLYIITGVMLVYTLWNGPFKTTFERIGDWFEMVLHGTPLYSLITLAGGGERFAMTLTALIIIIFIGMSPKAHLPKGGKVK